MGQWPFLLLIRPCNRGSSLGRAFFVFFVSFVAHLFFWPMSQVDNLRGSTRITWFVVQKSRVGRVRSDPSKNDDDAVTAGPVLFAFAPWRDSLSLVVVSLRPSPFPLRTLRF